MRSLGNSLVAGCRFTCTILAVAAGFSAGSGRAATWTSVSAGLPGSAVSVKSIVIAPGTPSVLYAKTVTRSGASALYRTNDGAGTWQAISTIPGVNQLLSDPRNPATIYASNAHGLFKSTNGGNSWSAAGAGLPDSGYIAALAIEPITSTTLYCVVSDRGANTIFKSTDAGASWQALSPGFPPLTYVTSLLLDPATPSRMYAVASMPQTGKPPNTILIESTDAGANWSVLDTGLPANGTFGFFAIAGSTPSTLYAEVFSGASNQNIASLYKSVDGAQSWDRLPLDIPSGAWVTSVAVDPTDASTVFVVVLFPMAEAGGILRSTDGGATWNALHLGLAANTPVQSLVIDPVSPSTIYMRAENRILKSSDRGATWTGMTNGLTATEVQTVATNRFDPATVYIGAANGVFKSADSGATWAKLSVLELSANDTGPVGNPFGGGPAFPYLLLIDPMNPDTLYAATSRGNGCFYADNLLFKSIDGGVTWNGNVSPVTSGCILGGFFAQSAGLKAIDPSNPSVLYVAEADDGDEGWWLLKSTDAGLSWKSVGDFPANLQAGVWSMAVDPSNSAILYAGLDDTPQYSDNGAATPGMGGVFKSTDGGTTWNKAGLSRAAVNLLIVDSVHPNVLYAATEGNYGTPRGFRGFFKSTDAGANWTAINNGLADLLELRSTVTALLIDPSNSNVLYAATSGSGVFKSADGGANWSAFNAGLTNFDIRGLALAPAPAHIVYAATSGGIFMVTDDAQ